MTQCPYRRMWQHVVLLAVRDAVVPYSSKDGKHNRIAADRWLRFGGKDFRQVCTSAGLDPDFIRDAYLSGRIDYKALASAIDKRIVE